jgi:protein SCO1/2
MSLNKKVSFTFLALTSFMLLFVLLQNLLFSSTHLQNSKLVVNKKIDSNILDSIKEQNIVLFFGYVGCVDICTPLLQELNAMYSSDAFQELQGSTAIVFVNLIPELKSDQAQLFASFFNDKFTGIHLSKKELYTIDRKFSLFYTPSISDKNELSHSDSIYFLKKENKALILKNIYMTHPFNAKQLTEDIKNNL